MHLLKTGYREFFTRKVVLLLLLFSGMQLCVYADHYIRVDAGFSYVRDMMDAKTGAPFIENISLSEVQEWIGKGKAESFRNSNGYAPSIGIGYRYTGKKLWFLDIGVGAEYRSRINPLYDITDVQQATVDDTNTPYIGHHTWNSREARLQHVGISVPVMIGVEWKHFYAMAGVRGNADIWGTSTEKGAYTLTGEYERYMNQLENIAGHGYVKDEPYELTAGSSFGWDVRACAEAGCRLNLYYVGVFAEYGFFGTASRYRPLLAGIRLTVLIPLTEQKHCMCWDN